MTTAGLEFLNNKLTDLQIPYEFMEWTSKIPKTYWVGEYTEIVSADEGGEINSDFILTGTTKEKFLTLETHKESIRGMFPDYGLTEILSNEWGIAVMFDGAFQIPSVQEGIHRMQITLKVKEWRNQ